MELDSHPYTNLQPKSAASEIRNLGYYGCSSDWGPNVTANRMPTTCPYCRQALLNQAAVRALQSAEGRLRQQILTAARAKAKELADARVSAVQEAAEDRVAQWRLKFDQLKTEHEAHAATLRTELTKEIEERVQRRSAGQLRSMTKTLEKAVADKDSLQRRLDQVSAGDRGAFNEDDMTRELKTAFADDHIERRGRGGDILHEVFYRAGVDRTSAGLIIYECKDTINWDNAFIIEARAAADQHRTPHAVIVTRTFPPKCREMVTRDGVVIVSPTRLIELIKVLRAGVIEIHRAGLTAQGRAQKTMALYRYFTSADFRQRFDAIVNLDRRLKKELDAERKVHERAWERREDAYNELSQNAAAVDERIRQVIEQRPELSAGLAELPAS
jgi:hypothetical protein